MISFGIISDVQYCDGPAHAGRHYRRSVAKLAHALETLNGQAVDFVINLGDTIDRDRESFDAILPLFGDSRAPVFHVLGNHDYAVRDEHLQAVPELLGIDRYYDFSIPPWRFLVLDGNEISTFSTQPGSPNHQRALAQLEDPRLGQRINARPWNGGISETQLAWLRRRLEEAERHGERMVVFCHYPLFPLDWHTLFNADEVIEILAMRDCVKVWISGHNHHGNYGCRGGLHFVNVRGMVETERQTAFAVAQLSDDALVITGFGREPDRHLTLR